MHALRWRSKRLRNFRSMSWPAQSRVSNSLRHRQLPTNASLTIYRDGLTSNASPTLTDWYSIQDIRVDVHGPPILGRSAVDVARRAGAFERVQLVLELHRGAATPRHVPAGNDGVDLAEVAATFLLRAGRPLTIVG